MKKVLLSIMIVFLITFNLVLSQDESTDNSKNGYEFSSYDWASNSLSIPFYGNERLKSERNLWLTGIRLLFELPLSYIIQANENNKLELGSVQVLPKFGFELNIYGGWVSLQAMIFLPSSIKFDEKSPIKTSIISTEREVNFEWGYSLGISLLDGIVCFSYNRIMLDERYFSKDPLTSSSFIAFSFQPSSSLQALIGAIKK